MKKILAVIAMCGMAAAIAAASPIGVQESGGVEITGLLGATPNTDANAVDLFTFAFNGAGGLTIQSWGYGGAAAGQTLSGNAVDYSDIGSGIAGGFATNLALYDSSGNLLADANTFLNGNPMACPDGNLDPNFFTCGDASLSLLSLSAGDYTLAIMAQNNDAAGNLSAGFLGGGSFIGADGQDSADYLVDIAGNATLPPGPVPEPATWMLLAGGLGLLAFWHKRRDAAGIA